MSDASQPTSPARKRWLFAGAAAFAVCTLGLLVHSSAQDADNCYTGTSPALTCFRAGNPAVASQVNGNFKRLADWIQVKVGASSEGGISASGVTSSGTVSTRDLAVTGTSTLASAAVTSGLTVAGNVTVQGSLTVNGETSGASRYVATADFVQTPGLLAANVANNSVALDGARLLDMCSDADGCMVRLLMADFDFNSPSAGVRTRDASAGPYHLDINRSGGFRVAEGPSTTIGDAVSRQFGVNGDNSLAHVLRVWNCYFTDSSYTPGGSAFTDGPDANPGNPSFFLLNYNNDTNYRPKCTLIIDD